VKKKGGFFMGIGLVRHLSNLKMTHNHLRKRSPFPEFHLSRSKFLIVYLQAPIEIYSHGTNPISTIKSLLRILAINSHPAGLDFNK
jgi:hypothetical protein